MNDNNLFRGVDCLVWLSAVFNDEILKVNKQSLEINMNNNIYNQEILKILSRIEEHLAILAEDKKNNG